MYFIIDTKERFTMINKTTSPSFGSTTIIFSKAEKALSLNDCTTKYLNELRKHSYYPKCYFGKIEPQKLADKIKTEHVGVITTPQGMMFVGKGGGANGHDSIISKIIKNLNPEAKYTDDIKPLDLIG